MRAPGPRFVEAGRRAGSVSVHDNTVVHGVTRLRKGVRYSLFVQRVAGAGGA